MRTAHTAPILIALIAAMAGCDVAQLRDQVAAAERAVTVADAQIEQLEARLAEADDEASAELLADLEQLRGLREELTSALTELRTRLDTAENPGDAAQAFGQAVAPFLPPPWNAVAPAVLAGIAGVLEVLRRRERADNETTIRSLEAARAAGLNLDDERVKGVLKATQPDRVKKKVNRVRSES